jgi:hypothetical protein
MTTQKTLKTKKVKKPKSILVIGKRWFDKVNGNTYCSARVYFDGIEVLRVPWTYGYGNYYEQVSSENLDKNGLINLEKYPNGMRESFWEYCRKNKINYLSEVSDGLKRDMVQWGDGQPNN